MSIVSDAVWDALAADLELDYDTDPQDLVRELVERVGGIGPIARYLSHQPLRGRLPAAGTAEFRRYRTERRSIERYLRGERHPSDDRLERLARAALAPVDARWREGMVITITGDCGINGYWRHPGGDRQEPGGGSRVLTIMVPSSEASELVDAFESGDRGAFDDLLGDDDLADLYGVEEIDCDEISSITVRAVGE